MTPDLASSRRRAVRGHLLALTSILVLAAGCAPDWRIVYQDAGVNDRERRIEITAKDSWVGPNEDRFGVQPEGSEHDLRIARFCTDEWAVTYPPTATGLPAPGDELELWAGPANHWTPGWSEPPATAAGVMASNGRTALFEATQEIDKALFSNGHIQLVVATPSDVQVSSSRFRLTSQASWLFNHPEPTDNLPGSLPKICPEPDIDTPPAETGVPPPAASVDPPPRRPRARHTPAIEHGP